uniref:Uncharacterized protein n=1 Tax=viral metagenome TaxID=1070528 RepID=A0A6C0D025_9ZZZZ
MNFCSRSIPLQYTNIKNFFNIITISFNGFRYRCILYEPSVSFSSFDKFI